MTTDTWSCSVIYGGNRRQALRDAISKLPSGVVWDLVVRHDAACPSLDWGDLGDCTCKRVTLDARGLR